MQKSQAMLSNINQGRDTRHSLMTPARNIYVNLSGRSLHSRRFPWHTRLRNFNKQWAAGMWADPNKAGPGVKTRQSQWPGAHGQCGVIIHVITLITRHGAPHCHCPVSRSSWHHPCLHDRFCAADADDTGLFQTITTSCHVRRNWGELMPACLCQWEARSGSWGPIRGRDVPEPSCHVARPGPVIMTLNLNLRRDERVYDDCGPMHSPK